MNQCNVFCQYAHFLPCLQGCFSAKGHPIAIFVETNMSLSFKLDSIHYFDTFSSFKENVIRIALLTF